MHYDQKRDFPFLGIDGRNRFNRCCGDDKKKRGYVCALIRPLLFQAGNQDGRQNNDRGNEQVEPEFFSLIFREIQVQQISGQNQDQ